MYCAVTFTRFVLTDSLLKAPTQYRSRDLYVNKNEQPCSSQASTRDTRGAVS
jgi:hypothetical protein